MRAPSKNSCGKWLNRLFVCVCVIFLFIRSLVKLDGWCNLSPANHFQVCARARECGYERAKDRSIKPITDNHIKRRLDNHIIYIMFYTTS